MSTFQPRTDDTGVPNSTGVSQGTGPNRTFEAIFSGLTNAAKNVINVKDTQTQLDIREDAQKDFDTTNQEFGLDAPDAGPAGLSSELERVQALQNAVEQGKISQVNYYGRLATLSKQLRTKYPGYEAIVDSTIQSVTGTRPANAYRDAIFQELGSLSEQASSDEKFKRQFNKENADVLSVLYGDDYFADPSKYDFNKVQADVGRLKGKTFQIDSAKKELDLMKGQGEFNDTQAKKVVSQDLSFIVQSTLNRSLGANGPTAQQTIDQFVAQGGGSGQQLQDFINNISLAESNTRAALYTKVQQDYVSKGLLSQDDANRAVDAALYPITKAKEAVLGGDFKLASKYATINKDMEDQQLNGMLQDPTVLAGKGLGNLNQALGDTFFNENRDAVSNVAAEVAGRIIGGNPEALGQAIDSGNQKVARASIDMTFKAIVDPKLTGDGFSNAIKSTFGPQAKDFMSPKVVQPSDLEALYLKFLNPQVTNAIVAKGSPEDLKLYTDWALEKAQAIPAFRAAAGDVNSARRVGPGDINFTFDPKSMRLTATTSGKAGDFETGPRAARALDAFNKVMVVMEPIFEANGKDEKDKLAMAKSFVKSLNVDLEGGVQGTFFDMIWKAIPDDLTKPLSDVIPNEGETIEPISFEDDGVLDFFSDRAEEIANIGPDMNDAVSAVVKGAKQIGSDLMEPVGTQKGITQELKPFLTGGKGESSLKFIPQFGSAMTRFLNDAPGKGIKIFSGYRSPERQAELFARAVKKYGSVAKARRWVAPPGASRHNMGYAADLRFATAEAQEWAHANAKKYGLNFRMGHEPWHIELGGGAKKGLGMGDLVEK